MNYHGLFVKGLDGKLVADRRISIGVDNRFFIPCLNDSTKIQIAFNTKKLLEEAFDIHKVPVDDRGEISALFDLERMNDDEIKAKCIEIRPFMAEVFDKWDGSALKNFTLTSVGIAIGHGNATRHFGKFTDLSVWIN
jgi:hypothetical protein